MTKKLKEIEGILSRNEDGNSYLFNQHDVTIADIHISPMLRRVWYALEVEDKHVSSISLNDYPLITKYVHTLSTHPELAPAYGCKWGFLNFLHLKRKDMTIKLPIPFDDRSYDETQTQKTLIIKDGASAKPRVNENFIRIYGHPLCPFVMRALLALKAKNVQYQFVGIDLTHKNKWHLDINGGLVPFLELPDGKIITESLDIADWLQDHTADGVNLYPGDDSNRQKIKDTIKEWIDNIVYFIIIGIKKELREGTSDEFVRKIEWVNSQLPDSEGEIYINGEAHETMADLMLLPFIHLAFKIRETQLKEKFYDHVSFDKNDKVKKWYENLFHKYSEALVEGPVFSNWLDKNIAADGPKVQLFYPLLD